MANLKHKIATGLALGGVSLASIFSSGCQEELSQMRKNELEAISFFTGMSSVSPDIDPALQAGSAVTRQEVGRELNRRDMIEAAEAGKTDVTVNIGHQEVKWWAYIKNLDTGKFVNDKPIREENHGAIKYLKSLEGPKAKKGYRVDVYRNDEWNSYYYLEFPKE